MLRPPKLKQSCMTVLMCSKFADVLMELFTHHPNQSQLGHKYKSEKNNEHENSINRLFFKMSILYCKDLNCDIFLIFTSLFFHVVFDDCVCKNP